MHLGSPVILDLNEVIALLAMGGLVKTGRLPPPALISIDAARLEKVHRFFVLATAPMTEMLFDGGLFP